MRATPAGPESDVPFAVARSLGLADVPWVQVHHGKTIFKTPPAAIMHACDCETRRAFVDVAQGKQLDLRAPMPGPVELKPREFMDPDGLRWLYYIGQCPMCRTVYWERMRR